MSIVIVIKSQIFAAHWHVHVGIENSKQFTPPQVTCTELPADLPVLGGIESQL